MLHMKQLYLLWTKPLPQNGFRWRQVLNPFSSCLELVKLPGFVLDIVYCSFVLSDPRKYKLVLDFVTPAKKEDS